MTRIHFIATLLTSSLLCGPGCDSDSDGETGMAETGMAETGMAETGMAETGGDAMVDEAAVLAAAMEFQTAMTRVSDEPRSTQHARADTVQFYVQPDMVELYLSIDPDAPTEVTFPEGALVVKENLDAMGETEGFFAMYKAFEGYDPEGNDWYWLRVDGEGSVGNSGKVGFCKDCHGGGPAGVSDFVFGVPLDNRL